jgi:hypothetical protein
MAEQETAGWVRIRPYPKVVFFYPSVLLAIVYSILTVFGVDISSNQSLNMIFMIVFSINVLVFSFDFSVLMFIIWVIIVVLGGVVLFLWNSLAQGGVFGTIGGILGAIRLEMNSHFYYYFTIFFLIVYLLVWIRTRFNYWDIRHNELFHKQGFFADTQRINAPNLSYKREIPDVFEYLLLRGGVLKLMPQNHEPFVIETVLNVKKKDAKVGEILSKMQVTVDTQR